MMSNEMSFEALINEILDEIRFEEKIEEEMKAFNTTGYNLFNKYRENLLEYWKDGHGEMLVLIYEMQGFLDCLTMQNLIQKENYMYLVDCFREKLKMIRSK